MEERYKYEFVAPFKSRAVVTNGFPYGNKNLHCGHITLFIHSDFYARFLRSRLGDNNVIYQSSTDCYGSPILEGYRKAVESNKFSGSIEDYVEKYHNIQKNVLDKYNISLNIFSASAFGEEKLVHERVSSEIFNKLLAGGHLKEMSTLQFYDEVKKTFLNGRQVVGKCPIDGCTSEHAYADECDLGHQYMPETLINPISALSGKTPTLKEAKNWYFDLDEHIDVLQKWTEDLEKNSTTRKFAIKEINEFLKKPEIYVKREYFDTFKSLKLPKYTILDDNKPSFTVIFDKLSDRETACKVMADAGIRYRTGKTLVPFRLTGNISWGVPVPNCTQTFWVWPESLWAQISISKAYLDGINNGYKWSDFWASKDSKVYQLIGEDNVYFYGPAQTAIWLALADNDMNIDLPDGKLQLTQIIDNKHTLFLGRKAGSSSAVKPPMADELLNYYSAEQIRMHLLSLNVSNNNASFMPKAFNPEAKEGELDPVVREYQMLSNVYNRALRTLFYSWQNLFDGIVPYGDVDDEYIEEARKFASNIEKFMYEQRFHMIIYEYDTYIRNINKYLSRYQKEFDSNLDLAKKVIINALYMCKVALVALQFAVPKSINDLAKKLHLNSDVFKYENILRPIYDFVEDPKHYKPDFLEPKSDFFKIPDIQRN